MTAPTDTPVEDAAEPIRKAVCALPRPLPLADIEKYTHALKVLFGPDLTMQEVGNKFVVFTPGKRCPCAECIDFTRKVADLDWLSYPGGMIVCETCGNKRCPHATSHDNDCTASNKPGQPGSSYR